MWWRFHSVDALIELSTNTTTPGWRHPMALVQVQCPDCHRADVVQYGKQAHGT